MTSPIYASDGEISRPAVPQQPVMVRLGDTGFVFTNGGVGLDVNEADIEELTYPSFGPMIEPF